MEESVNKQQNTDVFSPSPTPLSYSPKKSHTKTYLMVSLLVIILILFGGIAFFSTQNPSSSPKKETALAKASPPPDQKVITKTYLNDAYGFSLQYPPNGSIVTSRGVRSVDSVTAKGLATKELNVFTVQNQNYQIMTIQVFTNTNNLDVDQWVTDFVLGTPENVSKVVGDTTVAGTKTKKLSSFEGDHTDINYVVVNKQYTFLISCPDTNPNISASDLKNAKEGCLKTLSTFTFTDQPQATDTPALKTYKSKQLHITFELPECCSIIKDTSQQIEVGSKDPSGAIIPLLTFSPTFTVNYQSLKSCQEQNFQCIYDVSETSLGGKKARKFFVHYAVDSDYEVIQTTETPIIEFKAHILGGGNAIDIIASSVKFTYQ